MQIYVTKKKKRSKDYTRYAQVWLKDAAVVVMTWFRQLVHVTANTVLATLDH